MSLLITRHSQTDWNLKRKIQGKSDIALNETGIEQAKEVAKKLSNEPIDLIICSPLIRARQTAEIINGDRNAHGGISIAVNCYFNGIPTNGDVLKLGLHNCEYAKYEFQRRIEYEER